MNIVCVCGKHIPDYIETNRGRIYTCKFCGTSYDIEIVKVKQ